MKKNLGILLLFITLLFSNSNLCYAAESIPNVTQQKTEIINGVEVEIHTIKEGEILKIPVYLDSDKSNRLSARASVPVKVPYYVLEVWHDNSNWYWKFTKLPTATYLSFNGETHVTNYQGLSMGYVPTKSLSGLRRFLPGSRFLITGSMSSNLGVYPVIQAVQS